MDTPPAHFLELTETERSALGRAALEWALQYFSDQSHLPIYPTIGPGELSSRLPSALPIEPQEIDSVMAEFETIASNGRHNGHPRMFGYVQSSGSFAGVAADFLVSALNQNVTSWRSAPSATTVEHHVIEWLKEMVGFAPHGSGILLSGGSAANFAGLAVALRHSTSEDINRLGVTALGARPRVYTSTMTHMSIGKAAVMLGIGRDAIVQIPVDQQYRMDARALESQLASDVAAGFLPVCVVATAGDVNTGAIDPLDDIAGICANGARQVWLHVDGSYGALAAKTSRVGGTMAALERADSLSLDPHKWLYAPLDVGCLLVRPPGNVALRGAFSVAADYIDVIADRDMSDFAYWDHGPELSRRFRALKIWFIVKIHGARAIQQAIDDNIAAAQHLALAIQQSSDFELMAPVPLSIVCFRSRAGDDSFNKRLMLEVQRDGDCYLSNATLNGRFALRACIVNYRTTTADVEQLLATIRRVAARMTEGV